MVIKETQIQGNFYFLTMESFINGSFEEYATNSSNSSRNATDVILKQLNSQELIRLYTDYPVNIILGIIGIMGFIFNLFVLFVLLMFKNPRSKSVGTEFMITCQCIIDAMASFFVFLTTVLERSWSENLKKGDLLDEFICRIWVQKCPIWCSLITSTYSVLALTLDRYLAVIHPIFYQNRYSKGFALPKILSLSFITSALIFTYTYLTFAAGIKDDGRCYLFNAWPENIQRGMGFLILIFQFFFPLTAMTFCYLRMVVAIHYRINPLSENVADSMSKQQTTKLNSNEVAIWSTHGDKTNESKDLYDMIQPSVQGRNSQLVAAGKISSLRKGSSMSKLKLSLLKTSAFLSASYFVCWSSNQVLSSS